MNTRVASGQDGASGGQSGHHVCDGSLLEFMLPIVRAWRRLVLVPLLVGSAAVGISYAVPKTYQASTTILNQQQQSSAAAGALASLGALGALSGLSLGRSPADMYVSLM